MVKTIQVFGFPSTSTAEAVREFLERYTGKDTIFAVKFRQVKNGGPRGYAVVQFKTEKAAETIINLANQRLYYGTSYLKAKMLATDIVPKPRTYMHGMEHVSLHLGCQLSKERFSVLWKGVDVSVKFGTGMRKLHFFLSYHQVSYKLELSYENIWQIELYCPRDRSAKYLLIQLYGAPRIYQNVTPSSYSVYDNPDLNFFSEPPDDRWIRTTDFTPSFCIGQSSAFCLELPYDCTLPDLRENFVYYKKNESKFVLENGRPFSRNLVLVPIVGPSLGTGLSYRILFKVNFLVQNGCLPAPAVDETFYRLVNPNRMNIDIIEHVLEKLYHLKECCYEPSKWLYEQYMEIHKSRRLPRSPSISLDGGLAYIRRVQVTPCKVYFCGPEINVSNRVLRNYPEDVDNFLRVSFVDEELDKMHSTDLSSRMLSANGDRRTELYKRILSTLRNGIAIGDKKFEFLAFSSSQLRENSAWMFASRTGLTAEDIRKWMGDFSQIRNVAKYSARLGQSFSSSMETLSVARHEVEDIPDVETGWGENKYVFSDGIGKISADFAKKVAKKCGFTGSSIPSAFQIRYGGFKGVVAVDPTSSKKLSLRKSMLKYESENTKLDVLAFSKFQPCFLNRQLITLFSTLGVRDHIFEKKQREAVTQLDAILKDPLIAQEALELMSPGENTNVLKEMLKCGYMPDSEPYLAMMLQVFRASKLLELRTKSRIFLPNARSMMGCLDETRTLEYGQVFVQYSGTGNESDHHYVVQGVVVVAKNPCLHPGDVRILRAVNVPSLYHMVDCVVFPQKGKRPHPNECSGSDLDGDIYFVCWDPELIPPKQEEPMDYAPPPSMLLDHDVTVEEVQGYFANYMLNDSLGIIANAHTVFADKEYTKAMSPPCIALAKLFSIAVDFPKTGVPAVIPPELHVKLYPDFMDKPDKPTYQSQNVIGKLFREVKDITPHTSSIKSFTREVAIRAYDPDMEVDGFEDYIGDAFFHKSNYDYKLGNLMDYYGIKTEAEILSGSILKMSKSFTKRRDAEAITMAVRSLRKEARSWFNEKESAEESEDDPDAKASAWYHVTYHWTYWNLYNEGMNRDHYLSFAWCIYDKLISIKKKARARRSISLLQQRFSNGLTIR